MAELAQNLIDATREAGVARGEGINKQLTAA